MSTINELLIHAGELVLSFWDWIVAVSGAVGGGLDRILNPILSPLLALLNPICSAIAEVGYFFLDRLPIGVGLAILAVLVGVAALVPFRYLSNQKAIGRAKDDIKANLLALKLFRDELGTVFRCQFRLLWAILRLQRYVITPVLWMAPPMLLLLGQMAARYQWRPLHVGEAAVIKVAHGTPVALELAPGVTVEAGPVPGGGVTAWRIRASTPGRHVLSFTSGGVTVSKELTVGEGPGPASPLRAGARWTQQLLHPIEARIPSESGIQRIEIDYPARSSWFHGADYWVITFFVLSMAAALLLAPVFRVRF